MDLHDKFNEIFQDQVVGASVVFVKDIQATRVHYGFRSLTSHQLVDDETIFRIASISKLIIGMVAMKLVEEGRLDLDEDIGHILGYQVRNPKHPSIPITSRMLMEHTSSMTDGSSEGASARGYNGVNGHHYFVSLEDLLACDDSEFYASQTYADATPGKTYIYSNFGAGILACIIEKCSHQLFSEYVEEIFFRPLQMDASFKANRIVKKDKISDTFTGLNTNKTAQAFIDGTYPDYPIGNNFRGPAGGLFVSAFDLSKIMMALMNEGMVGDVRILSKQSIDTLFAMRFFASRHHPEKQYILNGFSGGAYGISSVMYFSKENHTGVCFIANGGNYKPAPTGLNHIQEAIIKILIDELS